DRRLRAEDLHRERVLVGGDAQVAERPLVSVLEPGAADHLGAHETRPEAPSLPPEGLYAHARHRGQHDARRDPHRPDPPFRMKIYLHRAEILAATGIDGPGRSE